MTARWAFMTVNLLPVNSNNSGDTLAPTLPITRRDVLTKILSKRPNAISYLLNITEDWVVSTFSSTRDRVQHGNATVSQEGIVYCMLHFNTAELFRCKYKLLYASNYRRASAHATATLLWQERWIGA